MDRKNYLQKTWTGVHTLLALCSSAGIDEKDVQYYKEKKSFSGTREINELPAQNRPSV